jgi:cytochrome c oxidase subunit 1
LEENMTATANVKRYPGVNRLTGAYIVVGLVALALGILMGLLQALEHAGINLYPLPLVQTYYQGLTLHGVLNVLVWTTFFICGFLTFATVQTLTRPLYSLRFGWFTFGLMLVGLLLAAWPLLTNDATVMFTFYPPLKAHPAYYIGLTLVVVGTWLVLANLILTYRRWRAENPGVRTPLTTFMSLITLTMWTIATFGVAAEMLFLLIPWSLGMVGGTDPLLARTLFWFTGHPIVYFWLLPAYVSWYAMVPKQAGGKLFSDPMARVAFILFLILSIPVGFHHQYTDPGIGEGWKFIHALFTFGVFFPSLLTFFNVVASLELGGRARGGTGWLMWIRNLPWQAPSFTSQVLAMILFAFGGIGGLVNASYNVNLVVHNTAWVPGHLHLTVGTAVTLTFIGILYWLVPYLTGKALYGRFAKRPYWP